MVQFIITIRKATVIAIFSIIGFTLTHAETLTEYEKNTFALDLGLGANFDLSSLNAEQKAVFDRRPSTVAQVAFRPSYYFSRHWGAYADLRFNIFRLHEAEKLMDILVPGLSALKPSITLGGSYRFEHSRWQIQPRLGIGYSNYGRLKGHTKKGEIETYQRRTGTMLCLDAGFSVAYRTSRVCALFIDLNTLQQLSPAKYTRTTIEDGTESGLTVKSHTWGRTMSVSVGIRLQTSSK